MNDGRWRMAVGERRRVPALALLAAAGTMAAAATVAAAGAVPTRLGAAGSAVPVWRPIGPYGGSVRVLAADGGGTIYAGTSGAGVFRSDDGLTWTPARAGLPGLFILDVVADPAAAGSLVAITTAGLARSGDGGASWTAITLRGNPSRLAVSPAAHLTVYAFGVPTSRRAAQLHRSDDGGGSWQPVATDLPPGTVFNAFVADPQTAGVLYGSGDRGIVFRSADGGAHWIAVQAADPQVSIGVLAIDPARPTTIYAATPGAPLQLLKSVDGGVTWTTRLIPIGGSFVALAVDPNSPSTLIGAAQLLPIGSAGPFHGIFKSVDGGQTWVREMTAPALPAGTAPDALSGLLLPAFASGHYYAATFDGPGVIASQDGGATWTAANQGLAAATVVRITPDPFTPGTLYAALGSGIAKSADGGASWAEANDGLVSFPGFGPQPISEVVADPVTPGLLYAAGDAVLGKGVLKSQDGGASWNPADPGFTVNSLAIDPRRPLWLYAAGFGSHQVCVGTPPQCTDTGTPRAAVSRDGGASWSELSRIERGDPGAFAAVRLAPVHTQTVDVVGTDSFKSQNGGRNWRRLPLPGPSAPLGLGAVSITDLAFDPAAPQTLYAAHATGEVLKSMDGGTTFAPAGALPALVVPISIAIDARPSGLVYLGTSWGVFGSADGGATWNRVGFGLDDFPVLSLTLDTRPPATLYAATADGGAFSLPLVPAGAAGPERR